MSCTDLNLKPCLSCYTQELLSKANATYQIRAATTSSKFGSDCYIDMYKKQLNRVKPKQLKILLTFLILTYRDDLTYLTAAMDSFPQYKNQYNKLLLLT